MLLADCECAVQGFLSLLQAGRRPELGIMWESPGLKSCLLPPEIQICHPAFGCAFGEGFGAIKDASFARAGLPLRILEASNVGKTLIAFQ